MGLDQIHSAITQMDGLTQQNVALVEEAAAAADALNERAHGLTRVVSVFKLDGAQAPAAGSARAVQARPIAKAAAPVRKLSGVTGAAPAAKARAKATSQPQPPKSRAVANGTDGDWEEF